MRELLVHRNFRNILAAQTLSMFGDWTLLLVFGIWGKSLTGSNAIAGLMIFAMAAPGLLAPLGGLLADRLPRRHLMISIDLLSAAAVLTLWFVRGPGQLWLLFAVAVWYGLSGTVFNAAIAGLVQNVVPKDSIGQANGLLTSVQQGLRLIGPLVGAGLFTAFGGGWVATLDAATFIASAILLYLMKHREARVERQAQSFFTEVGAGLAHIWRTPVLLHLTAATAICVAAFGLIEATIFALVDSGLHRPAAFVGVVVSVQGVGAILGGVVVTYAVKHIPLTSLVVGGQSIAAIGIAFMIIPKLPPVLLGAGLLGAALPISGVAAHTLFQTLTPNPVMGRVSAAADVANSLPYTLCIALGAVLVGLIPYQSVLIIVVLGCAGASVYAGLAFRKPEFQTSGKPT